MQHHEADKKGQYKKSVYKAHVEVTIVYIAKYGVYTESNIQVQAFQLKYR